MSSRCEICQKPGAFYVTVNNGTASTGRFLCAEHLESQGIDRAENYQEALLMIPILRKLLAFARENNRFPNNAELPEFGGIGSLPQNNFSEGLHYFEKLIDFIETNSRYPNEKELSDPFRAEDIEEE